MQLLTPDLGLFVWTLLAFLIVFFLLKKFAWPAIIKGLQDREDNINSSIATAEKIKLEMAQLKNDHEALLTKAREERSLMLKEAKDIKDKMINDAKSRQKEPQQKLWQTHRQASINKKWPPLPTLKTRLVNW